MGRSERTNLSRWKISVMHRRQFFKLTDSGASGALWSSCGLGPDGGGTRGQGRLLVLAPMALDLLGVEKPAYMEGWSFSCQDVLVSSFG